MKTGTDLGNVVEQSFNVDLKPLEAALNQEDNRRGVDIDETGAWVRYPSSPDGRYSLGVGLTRDGRFVFTVENKDGEPPGRVNLTITGKKGNDTYPLHLTNSVWLERNKLTERVGQGPYNVVVKPA